MKVEDVLRREYPLRLRQLAKEFDVDEMLVTKKYLNNFVIGKKEVKFYFQNNVDHCIHVNYETTKLIFILPLKIFRLIIKKEISF